MGKTYSQRGRTMMKKQEQIDFIYEQLSSYWPKYKNKKREAKIHKHAYTSLIGVMLSAQSQDARTAVACRQLFALANTPEDMLKLSQEEIIEAIRPAGLHNAKSKNILAKLLTSRQLTNKLHLNYYEYLKMASKISENSKVAIRNIRRDGIEKVKKLEKEKEFGQDDSKKYQLTIEKITSDQIKIIEDILKTKEEDLRNI